MYSVHTETIIKKIKNKLKLLTVGKYIPSQRIAKQIDIDDDDW